MLILGASGLTGSKIFDFFSKRHEVIGTYFTAATPNERARNLVHLDVTQPHLLEKLILDTNSDVILYCASLSGPDRCEENPFLAEAINYDGAKRAASVAMTLSKKFVYLSSDYVFGDSGFASMTEADKPSPINVYGHTKRKMEDFLLDKAVDFLILRTSLIYGFSPNNDSRGLVNWVVNELSKGKEIFCDDKILRYPMLSDDVAVALDRLLAQDHTGIFHLSGPEGYTKYDLAKRVADVYGLPSHLIIPQDEASQKLPAKRPLQLKLSTTKIESTGAHFTNVEEGIKIHRRQGGCLFRMIYSVRPDMLVSGQNASEFRIQAGRRLANVAPAPNADIVVPIPESGLYSATGFSAESKVPLFFGIIRDYMTEKTLYSSSQSSRKTKLDQKLIIIDSVVRNKNIILIDEAILSGSTIAVVVEKLKAAGVKDIHIRIPSPIMRHSCTGKILPKIELLYDSFEKFGKFDQRDFESYLASRLAVSSVGFLPVQDFLGVVNQKKNVCFDCFERNGHP